MATATKVKVKVHKSIDTMQVDLSKQIKAEMIKQGIIPNYLAKISGLAKSQISKILNSKHSVQINTIVKVLSALNLKMTIDCTGDDGEEINLKINIKK